MQVPAIPPPHYEGGHPISGCQRDGGDRDTVPHPVVLRRRAHIRSSSKNGRDNPSIRRRTTLGGSAPQVPTGRSCKASRQLAICSREAAKRSSTRRACCTSRPAVLKIRKRSRLGRARNSSAGKASRFNAVSTL